MLNLVAAELWRRGEVWAARVPVKSGRVTVRQYLREGFGSPSNSLFMAPKISSPASRIGRRGWSFRIRSSKET
jgi:hypothetical protein